jgi:hypothetical protein
VLLAILAVALAGAVYVQWPRTADPARAASTARGAARPVAGTPGVAAPDVHLEELEAARAKPAEVERNLFKFKPRPAPPPASAREPIAPPGPIVPSGPPPPPPLPPITLKFIGTIETANGQKVAILSDGRSLPVYGKEGDTVLGQYKILRIGVESIEMAYLDGRGRQTIRLSGS